MTTNRIPILTPHGCLMLAPVAEAVPLPDGLSARLESAFGRGGGHGLLDLGLREVGTALPAAFGYWRDFAARYVTALCTADQSGEVVPPATETLAVLANAAPPMPGGEYLNAEVLAGLWSQIGEACRLERAQAKVALQEFLRAGNPAWHLVGRVHFNLAENRSDEEAPFAFIATYTTQLSAQGRAQHLPLGEALREYAGARNKARLLALLQPVQEGAAQCPWLRAMVEAGEIYHPLRWTAVDALQFLTDVPKLEAAGIVVRTPNTWQTGRPPRPTIRATAGGSVPGGLGKDALLDFQVELTLGEERLTAAEIRALLEGADGLQFLRGRWVEVDRAKLAQLLERFRAVEAAAAAAGGMPFAAAMRLVAGVSMADEGGAAATDPQWSQVTAGPWLAEILRDLRSPEGLARIDPGTPLRATLRPYQQTGVRWLYLLHRLGLGACLADDMGLGKTIQVLSLLLVLKQESSRKRRTQEPTISILVAPASLLANWAAEVARCAPTLKALIAHPSSVSATDLKAMTPRALVQIDLIITSYGALLRYDWLTSTRWRIAVIDEAQAIKNPGAKQTRAVKSLDAGTRIALTGTPVESLAAALDTADGMKRKGIVLAFLMRFKQSPRSSRSSRRRRSGSGRRFHARARRRAQFAVDRSAGGRTRRDEDSDRRMPSWSCSHGGGWSRRAATWLPGAAVFSAPVPPLRDQKRFVRFRGRLGPRQQR